MLTTIFHSSVHSSCVTETEDVEFRNTVLLSFGELNSRVDTDLEIVADRRSVNTLGNQV